MIDEFTPTDEQLRIITYEAEPLRVAAGAGTGKTTTIVERIVHLVTSGNDPARILGVTFTNKAAAELNARVLGALGLETGDRMPEVATYHSFAASILDEFGAFVGYSGTPILMDDGHRTELATNVLRTIEAPDLDLTSLPTRRREMLGLASTMIDNLVEPEAIRAIAPSGQTDDGHEDADDTLAMWRKRLGLADAAGLFESEKQRLGLVEYGDLIRLAVRVVTESPETAANISSRYDHVVLDEYQDTDPAQRLLLTTLFAGTVPVLAVGDTDQTIYEWRGASAENFAAFPNDFRRSDSSETETLPLSENRRSDTRVIDLANEIRAKLPHVDGALPLRSVPGAPPGSVVTAWFNTETSEAAWIAETIMHLRSDGARWDEIAVLCRKRLHFEPIVAHLAAEDIPFAVASMGKLLEVPMIADLVAWLRVIESPNDEASLLRIWLGGRFRLGMSPVGVLRGACDRDRGETLFDAALVAGQLDGLSDEATRRVEQFLDLHCELTSSSQVASVPAIVESIVDRLGFWDEIAALDPGTATTARLNLGKFTDLTRQWRPIEGAPTLGRFLRYLSALNESGRADELAAAMPPVANAVSVMTAHASKGLEWPHVFVPALANNVFPSSPRALDDPDRISQALPYELRLDADIHQEAAAVSGKERSVILKRRHLDQEWRLAYVAATRAAKSLFLTGHAWDGTIKKPRIPSELWTIANTMSGGEHGPMEDIDDSAPVRAIVTAESQPPDPLFEQDSADALRRTIVDPAWIEEAFPDWVTAVDDRVSQLELAIDDLSSPTAAEPSGPFSVSVTNLVALAGCSLRFKWIHHDRLPRKPRRSATLGTAFHRQVELHNLGVIAFDDPGEETYDTVESKSGETGPSSDPWSLFTESRFAVETPIHIEAPFELPIGNGTIRGKVDAVYEPAPGRWEIVDYKSGRHRDDPARGVQLEAYALAVTDGALSAESPSAIDVTFAYFGGSELVEVSESVDEAWLLRARKRVEGLVEQGANGPFDASPSGDCRWCDFLHLCPEGQQEVKRHRVT